MPFNGSGTFSIVNVFVPNTTILSAAVNQNFSDIATGLSDCLTRDGQAGMTAVLKLISGSSSAPSLSFTADTKTGAYLPATGVLGLVANALGIKVNSEVYAAASMLPSSGGSGFVVGDTVYGPTANAIVPFVATVATLSGSAIATVTVTVPGIYITKPTNPVTPSSTSGSGTGATLTVTWNDPTASDYKLGITDLADAALWTKLGASSFVSGIMGKANGTDYFKSLVTVGSGLSLTGGTLSSLLPLPRGYIDGCTISNSSGGTVNLDFAAGACRDSTNAQNITCTAITAKVVGSAWSAGNSGGLLDTGAIGNNTYHVYAIIKSDLSGQDYAISLSASGPNTGGNLSAYAGGYFRRIGSIVRASSAVLLFTQYGDDFYLSTPVLDIANGSPGTSANTGTLASAPTGIKVKAYLNANSDTGTGVYKSSLDAADLAPSGTVAPLASYTIGGTTTIGTQDQVWTNTSAQIRYRAGANQPVRIATLGWLDMRNKNV